MFNTFSDGYKNDRGYWTPPLSNCCGARIVYFNPDANIYIQWDGYTNSEQRITIDDLKCSKCNRSFSRTKKFIVLIELPESMEDISDTSDAVDTLYAIDDGQLDGKVTIKKVEAADRVFLKNLTGLDS